MRYSTATLGVMAAGLLVLGPAATADAGFCDSLTPQLSAFISGLKAEVPKGQAAVMSWSKAKIAKLLPSWAPSGLKEWLTAGLTKGLAYATSKASQILPKLSGCPQSLDGCTLANAPGKLKAFADCAVHAFK